VAKRTGSPFLDEHFLHHLDQFVIIKNLLDDVRMGLSIVFSVRKATFPTHLFSPFKEHYKISLFLWQENEMVNVSGDNEGGQGILKNC